MCIFISSLLFPSSDFFNFITSFLPFLLISFAFYLALQRLVSMSQMIFCLFFYFFSNFSLYFGRFLSFCIFFYSDPRQNSKSVICSDKHPDGIVDDGGRSLFSVGLCLLDFLVIV